MTLAEAREAWRLHRKALAEGKVLVAVDAPTQVAALIVSAVVAQWLEAWRRDKRTNTVKIVERQLKTEILPAWGERDIRTIGKHELLGLLDSITHRGAVVQALRVFATLKTFFRWLRKRDVILVIWNLRAGARVCQSEEVLEADLVYKTNVQGRTWSRCKGWDCRASKWLGRQ